MIPDETAVFRFPQLPLRQRVTYIILMAISAAVAIGLLFTVGDISLRARDQGTMAVIGILVFLMFSAGCWWIAYSCTFWAFPFRFEVDAERRECCYRWGDWRRRRRDLSSAVALEGTLFEPQNTGYGWQIYALEAESGPDFGDGIHLYHTPDRYDSEEEAKAACEKMLQPLAAHLELPYSIRSRKL